MNNIDLHFKWAAPLAADIAAARYSVMISSLSMHPPRGRSGNNLGLLFDALAAAAARGVTVDIVLAAVSKSHPATAFNNAAAATLAALGCRAHFARPERLLHAKTCVVDFEIVWVGSGNWTAAAATFNHEAYIRAESCAMAATMRDHWISEGFING